jgi:antitoxin VapB
METTEEGTIMAATHIATVTEDGVDTVVRFSGKVRLPQGPVSVREIEATGEIVLAPIAKERPMNRPPVDLKLFSDGSAKRMSWDEFFDLVGTLDVPEEYMAERPMNRLPVERTIFEDD